MGDVPNELRAMTPGKARSCCVEVVLDAASRGGYTLRELALALNAVRDVCAASDSPGGTPVPGAASRAYKPGSRPRRTRGMSEPSWLKVRAHYPEGFWVGAVFPARGSAVAAMLRARGMRVGLYRKAGAKRPAYWAGEHPPPPG